MIMVTKQGLKKDPKLADKLDKAVFPGLQGGPHNNTIAGIAICLKEAQSPAFKKYIKQVVKNSKTLAKALTKCGFKLSTGGTDNHLMLIDLTNKHINGWCAGWALESAGIIANRNTIPNDTRSAYYTSGLRLGTPFVTTIGLKEKDMKKIALWINKVINITQKLVNQDIESQDKDKAKAARNAFRKAIADNTELKQIAQEVKTLVQKFAKHLA